MNVYSSIILSVLAISLWCAEPSEAVPRKVCNDFDGDGRTDPAVYYKASGAWLIFQTSTLTVRTELFGSGNCLPAPGDFDGDGKTDLVLFDSATAMWYGRLSSGGEASGQFGQPGDWPTPADFDGDGKTDLCVYTPRTGFWTAYLSKSKVLGSVQWGYLGDFRSWENPQTYTVLPMPFDYNQDGVDDLGYYYRGLSMASSGWSLLYVGGGTEYYNWGSSGSLPAPGKCQVKMADAPYGICVYKIKAQDPAKSAEWSIPYRNAFYMGVYGQTLPVPAGDYDGNGFDDNAVYNYNTGLWTVVLNTGGAEVEDRVRVDLQLGGPGAVPANIYSTIYALARYSPKPW